METVMEDQEDEFAGAEEVLDISQLCRACASPNEYLIPIFHGEGLQYDLKHKVSRLPLQIKETDKLPVQLCYQCASTLIAFSDLVEGCAEADAKLKSLLPEGSSDPTTSLDDQTGLQSDEKSLGLQSSAASSIVETSQKVSPELNAEGVAEQDVSSMDQEDIAIEPMQQRFSNPLNFYHQIQSVVREKLLIPEAALFCIYCGQIELSLPELMKHMNVRHQTTCEKESEVKIDKIKPKNRRQRSVRNTRSTQLKTKRHRLKKDLVKEYVNEQLIAEEKGQNGKTEKKQKYEEKEPEEGQNGKAEKKHKYEEKEPEEASNVFSDDSINSDDIRSFLATKKEASSNVEDCVETGYDGSPSPNVENNLDGSLIDSLTGADSEEFACNYCTSLFQPNKVLVKHKLECYREVRLKSIQSKLSRSRQNRIPQQCEICMKTFRDKRDLMRHMTVHRKKKQQRLGKIPHECEICMKTFRSKRDMMRHMTVHRKEKKPKLGRIPAQCEICVKTFRDKRDLKRHMTVHEEKKEKLKQSTCEICGKQFSNNQYVLSHINRVHLKIKNYACDICGRMFSDHKARSDHRRTHTGEKPFVCEICGKAFATHTNIYIHRRSHTDNFPHQCSTCNKRYRTRYALTMHIRSHTGEMPFPCELCGRRFKEKNRLNRHMREKHATDKPHICVLCGVAFSVKRYLKLHMTKHAEMGQHPASQNPDSDNLIFETL